MLSRDPAVLLARPVDRPIESVIADVFEPKMLERKRDPRSAIGEFAAPEANDAGLEVMLESTLGLFAGLEMRLNICPRNPG
jgi:hypothetical protein